MAIINNIACPECTKNGHDKTQNHLMVFDDGSSYCNHAHFHDSGTPLYIPAGEGGSITDLPIKGDIRYTPQQFNEMVKSGKLLDPKLRAIALGGMKMIDRLEVMNEEERAEQEREWQLDVEHYHKLKYNNLVMRHIKVEFAKFYGIKVGRAPAEEGQKRGKINRYYYPRHENGVLVGAKCRTLPKDFRHGHLGKLCGHQDLMGMETIGSVLQSGNTMHTLMIVGGENDAPAAQQMLVESQIGTKYEGRFHHVWSVNKGEQALQEILDNREDINKFKRIIWAFDDDEVGQKMNRDCARLFPEKSMFLKYPRGCKDPNQCLKTGKAKEFVDAWFNPVDLTQLSGTAVRSIHSISSELKAARPEQGLSWTFAPSLNKVTLGIRKNQLIVIGAGVGVGKTEFCREVVKCLVDQDQSVGIISTEDPYLKVARSFIGKWIDKRIELPPTNDPAEDGYRKILDYTEADAEAAIDTLTGINKLFVADMKDGTSIEKVVDAALEFYSMGIDNIILDNLTGIDVDSKSNKVEFLDRVVKELGHLKDSRPMTIFLVTHLSRVGGQRIPHEQGGEVWLSDARGSNAIGQWASYFLSVERNTMAKDMEIKTTTYIGCVKDRDQGIHTGDKVMLKGDEESGRLREPDYGGYIPAGSLVKSGGRTFNDGTGEKQSKPKKGKIPEPSDDEDEDDAQF